MANAQAACSIRSYRPGDEQAQIEIYNLATGGLPGYKPASADEVSRRYRAAGFDPGSKLYAEQDERIVGYVSFSENGRVSLPWCLPEAGHVRPALLEAALDAMRARGLRRVWAAYRADWHAVQAALAALGFRRLHEVINFAAAIAALPQGSSAMSAAPLERSDLARLFELDPSAFGVASAAELAAAWFDGPYLAADSFFALIDLAGPTLVGAGVAVVNALYADPAKIDPRMPCFRLGAVGTEAERTKRVQGLFSYAAPRERAANHAVAQAALGEACRRFRRAGLERAAAQCRSDRPVELAFYDAHFERQGSFPVLVRDL